MAELQTIVVRRNIRRHRQLKCAAGTLLVVVIALGYWAGRLTAHGELATARAALKDIEAQRSALHARNEQISRELVQLRVSAEVDQTSIEALRQTLRREQRSAARLQEELRFYRGLMAPTEQEQGLGIRAWEAQALPEPQRYHYRLTLQQLAVEHSLLSGSVSVEIAGHLNGAEYSVPLQELMIGSDPSRLKLRFRYFQHIEGEIELPQGFEPLRVTVVATSARPRRHRVERQFDWDEAGSTAPVVVQSVD